MSFDTSQQSSNEKARQQFCRGQTLLKEKKPKEAIPLLKESLRINPSDRETQAALQDALEALNWSTTYFCQNCGGFIKPERDYPEIKFDGLCPRCGHGISTRLEKTIGFTELSLKLIMFAIFPMVTLVFCIFPMWTYKWGGFYYKLAPILSVIYAAINLTPAFILLLHAFDPTGESSTLALSSIYEFLSPLERVHPALFFTAEILILFIVIYLSLLFILTPIIYIHRKGYWKNKQHQKRIIIITSIYVALVVLRRVTSGVLE